DSLLRSANIEANLDTKNLNFVTSLMDASQRKLYTIPQDMNLRAKASMKGTLYETEVVFTEKGGKIELTGEYNGKNEIYTADLSIDSLQLHDFMPQDSLYSLTASLAVDGKGLDFLSPSTHLNANAAVHDFHYGMYDLSGIQLDAALSKSAALLTFNSNNKLFSLQARLNALLNKRKGEANLEINLSRLDFQELRITDKPFATSLLFSLNAKTDWKKAVSFTGNIRDIKFITQKKIFTPKNVDFNAATDKDSTFAYLQAGDLKLAFKSKEGIERLLQETSSFGKDLMSQLKERRIDQNELKQRLPGVRLRLTAGRNNPLSNYLAMSNISFKELLIDLSTTTGKGLSGDAHIYSMGLDSLQLDVIRLEISQDTTGVKFSGNLANNPGNKQVVFESWIEGGITEHGGELMFTYLDDKGETGVLLGLRAALRPNGVAFRFFPENPTIVFRPFHLNKDNYIFIGNDNRVSANLEMLDDKGTGLKLYSLPDTTALQDIGVELRRIELADVGEVIPYLPNITGLLSAEIHYTQTKTSLQVATEVRVDSLTYEKEKIGNMLLEAVYLPGNGDDHHLDAHLSHNGTEIVSAGGIYHTSGEGLLDANATLEHFPLSIANAFVPDHMAKLSGDMDGEMTVVGKLSHPKIDGQLILDDVAVYVPQAGARFRFDNRPLRVENNKLAFDHFSIFTKGTNPFTIDGEVDFSNLDAMTADLKMNAVNYELLNAPRTKESLIYGKVFVNFNSTVRGPLDALVMRGDVSLQGNTNVTYVLKDSPLTVQDRLGDLVTFVNFNDTTKATQEQPKIVALGGMDMLMTVHIDPAVQLKVDLSADRESRVELEGGGDLSLQYTPQGDLLLSGRYTLNSGLLKYSLPVFPAKTFTIQSGSYVNWTGNPMDPSLNITALERTRTSVTQDNQSPRMVNFDVVISVKNRLENLALVFNLEAPEDMAIQNQLSAMSAEERGKQAVTMLATGMYLAQTTSGKGGLDMGAALNSFLQNEISSIAGNALKTID
ncbi:MAG: translocation/assembly module TamB domain-containing protein, partial [Bacteroidaceae bacterium]